MATWQENLVSILRNLRSKASAAEQHEIEQEEKIAQLNARIEDLEIMAVWAKETIEAMISAKRNVPDEREGTSVSNSTRPTKEVWPKGSGGSH